MKLIKKCHKVVSDSNSNVTMNYKITIFNIQPRYTFSDDSPAISRLLVVDKAARGWKYETNKETHQCYE